MNWDTTDRDIKPCYAGLETMTVDDYLAGEMAQPEGRVWIYSHWMALQLEIPWLEVLDAASTAQPDGTVYLWTAAGDYFVPANTRVYFKGEDVS